MVRILYFSEPVMEEISFLRSEISIFNISLVTRFWYYLLSALTVLCDTWSICPSLLLCWITHRHSPFSNSQECHTSNIWAPSWDGPLISPVRHHHILLHDIHLSPLLWLVYLIRMYYVLEVFLQELWLYFQINWSTR